MRCLFPPLGPVMAEPTGKCPRSPLRLLRKSVNMQRTPFFSSLLFPCLLLSSLASFCLVLSCLVLSCFLLACFVLFCLSLSCSVLPVWSCLGLVLSCRVLPCLVLLFFVVVWYGEREHCYSILPGRETNFNIESTKQLSKHTRNIIGSGTHFESILGPWADLGPSWDLKC